MKKSVKGIIGLCAALAVLGGGLAALKLSEPEDTGESSGSKATEVSGAGEVILAAEDIASIDVKNAETEFTVTSEKKESEDAASTYTLKGYEKLPMDTSIIGTMPNNVKGLTSSAIAADDSSALEKYGLESPQITADIHYASGNTVTLYIGDAAPNGSDTYVKTSESDTVYTVSTSRIANYSKTAEELVNPVILKEPDKENYPKINSVVIERDDIDYDIVLEYDPASDIEGHVGGSSATHVMKEPIFAYLTVEKSTDITNGMFGLSSKGIYCIAPDESDLAEAGLINPFCTVTMSCDDGNTYVLKLSEPYTDEDNEKMYYAMLEGTDIIYIVSAEKAKWGDVNPIDITSMYAIATYVWDITDMKITGKNVEETEIKITKKASSADVTALRAKDFDVTVNGKETDSEHYREFYGLMIYATAEELALDAKIPDEEPILAIEYTDSFAGKKESVEFYDYSSLYTLMVMNGESKYLCVKSFAETMADNVKRIATGEDYIETWK